MFDYSIAFDSSGYLLLLALLPVLWWVSYRTLSGLGKVRRFVALVLRTLVLVLLVLALAEMQVVRSNDRLTVIYLLDQSLSVPEAQKRQWIEYVNASILEHRNQDKEDRAGVIVFGRDAAVEIPPFDDDVAVPMAIESLIDRQYTDLAGAMKLAMALFPHDASKRIVIVTDGNENLGDAMTQAKMLVDAGVGIDVAPIQIQARGEVAVEKLAVSSDVRRGQPFDLRVVLNNTTTPSPGHSGAIKGKLRIIRRAGDREQTLAEEPVELPPGKKVLTVREEIDQADFYTYEARFVPDDPADDAMPQNNRATTFTHVRGRGHVLLIEDWANKGEFDYLVERLRSENLEVTVQPSDQLFANLSELQRYDTVVLANVPRTSGDDADQLTNFSDEQILMLTRNTQQMGSGLVMLGGPNSFGAGGWTNTELEKAMPVDFQIKSAKVVPVGALAMLMHASEMARGNHWQKKVAQEAIKALGAQDYCGLLHWNGTDQWLWGRPRGMIRVGAARQNMLAALDRMTPGDMPQFDPAMRLANAAFAKLPDAAIKHMIIISDGDPSPPNPGTIQSLKTQGVKVTTVAVGTHGPPGSTPLQKIATATGGKYYVVNNPKALPRIYQREARRVARPLVYENKEGLTPQVRFPHEMIKGLNDQIPPITGFVLTSVKDSPLVEVALVSPKPSGENNATVLASWTYGLGKAVVLTTDAGKRWATSWTGWDNYDKMFSQIVRWSMRPVSDTGNFTVATDIQDGQGRIVITAMDKDDEFLNFLNMSGTVVGPNMEPIDLRVRQTAPGRYVGTFEATDAGSYFVMVNPGGGKAPLRTGVNVAYSDEFRDRQSNTALLETLAAMAPAEGKPGKVIVDPNGHNDLESLLVFNPFRRGDLPKSTASQDVWHLLMLIASCLFFADVFNRRVNVSFTWLPPLAAKVRDSVLQRSSAPAPSETMSRLQSRKAAIGDHLEQKRAATRFEPTPDEPIDMEVLQQQETAGPREPQPAGPDKKTMAPEKKEESYTERLLKAKKKVWEDRNK